MPHLSPHDVMTIFLALAVLLGCAKLAAELMQKIGQPSILGEISVGIFLGPTVLGRFRPHVYETLFPTVGEHSPDRDQCVRAFLLRQHRIKDRLHFQV
jgi:hypothetical protein